MIIVNNPGSWSAIYPLLKHPEWNGLSSADLVFPFFLIAVGMSIPFSYARRKEQDSLKSVKNSRKAILLRKFLLYQHIFVRGAILIGSGLLINAFPSFEWNGLRIPGVLQRIGVVYICCYMVFIHVNPRIIFLLFLSILLGYLYLIVFIPPPDWNGFRSILGYNAGWGLFDYEYWKNALSIKEFNFTAYYNLSAYVDRSLLYGHLWKFTKTWDPEGILSTIPSIATSMIGLWIGSIKIRNSDSQSIHEKSISKISLWLGGFAMIAAGLILDEYFPINKSIWSSSFVLITGGIASVFIAVLDSVPSIWRQHFEPILLFGRYALFVFIFSAIFSRLLILNINGIVPKSWLVTKFFTWENSHLSSLVYSVAMLLFIWIVTYFRSKIVIKIPHFNK
ncbi:acyltransferase family protein [Leptospira sp. GIMC2001]|uniref:acyltransferase family protein n=1 Tax=Leptospira sp. GIMC2001 TaxID=1513297 RepID=UPI003FA56871